MERISKQTKQQNKKACEKKVQQVWRAGIYARLSVDNHNEKNESIDTQIQIMKEYIRQSEDIECIDCYTDLGRTGTDFDREGFDRLMQDVRCRKINCVIVKDFSRFGRNYIETGNYIEKIFPFFNVRFIAAADGYDSHRTSGKNDIFVVNLKNIVNELYAKDCAEKVRAIKKSKLEQGCYVGGIPSYGYSAKWINGKKVLFPEEGTSDIVRKIYELSDKGTSIKSIISYLYDKRVHRPKEYRQTGHIYCEKGEILKQWTDGTIRSMLTNHVYIGTLIQIRIDEKVYRTRGKCYIEPDEVIMVEHTHEPIIDEDTFYRISEQFVKRAIKQQGQHGKEKLAEDIEAEEIYKDLLYCGECGHKLKRTCTSKPKTYGVSVRTYSYGCPNSMHIDETKCGNHYMAQNTINKIVREILHKEFDLSGIDAKKLVDFNRTQAEKAKKDAAKRENEVQQQLQKSDIEMSSLYIQYRTGGISKEVFLERKGKREKDKEDLQREVFRLQMDKERIDKETEKRNHFIRCLWKGKESAVLDGQVIHCLVKKIVIYKDRRVEIVFNFSKEEFQQCRKEASAR